MIVDQHFGWIAVRFQPGTSYSARAVAVARAGTRSFEDRVEFENEMIIALPLREGGSTPEQEWISTRTALEQCSDVAAVWPILSSDDQLIVPTGRIAIGLKEIALDESELRQQLEKFDCQIVERIDEVILVERLDKPFDIEETTDICEKITDLSSVDFAEDDFLNFEDEPPPPPTNDPNAVGNQQALILTRTFEAWETFRTGRRSIQIAVVDQGVDVRHPDLRQAITTRFDALHNDRFEEPRDWNWHGTACAGLCAGTGKVRVAGIGNGCGLISVRVGGSPQPALRPRVSPRAVLRGIKWAVTESEASVINLSWSLPFPARSSRSKRIERAIQSAARRGRGGRGTIIVAAAGNKETPVRFPARLREVIAVAASDMNDNIKTRDQGDPDWGSAFGRQILVTAPGVNVLSTDNVKRAGREKGNYLSFNGTSAASALVSGLAGLILSIQPKLTAQQVHRIIALSADQVGPIPYDQDSVLPRKRNDLYGFGRINVLNALRMASSIDPE